MHQACECQLAFACCAMASKKGSLAMKAKAGGHLCKLVGKSQLRPTTGVKRQSQISIAPHFAAPFHDANPSPFNQCEGTTCSTIWQGNPVVVVKPLPPKTAPCVLKRELQFLNNPDQTHNFLSTLTMKSAVHADTDHDSTCVCSRPTPAMMSQPMTKERTHEVATDCARHNVCLADVQLEAL